MSLQIKVLTGKALATALGLSVTSLGVALPLQAQTTSIDTIEDETVADLLAENDCAILTDEGLIIQVDGADADTDGDGRAERFCTPARVDSLSKNEKLGHVTTLTQTDYDDDGEYESNEGLVIDLINIRSVREVVPGNYAIIISRTGTVTEAAIDVVEVSEEDALALLAEIERSRTTVVEIQEEEITPAPAPIPAPIPAPVPAPVPRVQPTPAPPVPALW